MFEGLFSDVSKLIFCSIFSYCSSVHVFFEVYKMLLSKVCSCPFGLKKSRVFSSSEKIVERNEPTLRSRSKKGGGSLRPSISTPQLGRPRPDLGSTFGLLFVYVRSTMWKLLSHLGPNFVNFGDAAQPTF